MKAPDKITFEVLKDGTVKIDTDGISPANHKSADDLIAFLNGLLGGESTTTKKRMGHLHSVMHEHEHTGGGHSHS